MPLCLFVSSAPISATLQDGMWRKYRFIYNVEIGKII